MRYANCVSGIVNTGAISLAPPDSGTVHLLQLSGMLPDSAIEDWKQLLQSSEMAGVVRLREFEDQQRAITRRALTRLMVAEYLKVRPDEIVFGCSERGKPFIVSPKTALCFNVSHSGDEILWGFSSGAAIGVDIEVLRPVHDSDLIVNRFMAPEERREFEAVDAEHRMEALLSWWTSKEACMKASGLGLAMPTQDFVVPILCEPVRALVMLSMARQSWTLFAFNKVAGTVGACAVAGSATSISMRHLGAWGWGLDAEMIRAGAKNP